jgi:hypothetical protein
VRRTRRGRASACRHRWPPQLAGCRLDRDAAGRPSRGRRRDGDVPGRWRGVCRRRGMLGDSGALISAARDRVDRRRRRLGAGHGGGRIGCRRRCRLRHGGRLRGQEGERIEVTLRLGRRADAEVHERLRHFGLPRRTDRRDAFALSDRRPLGSRDRAQVRQRDRQPVGRRDRETLARDRHRARERHGAGRRRDNGGALIGADVDASVLPGGVRVCRVEHEHLQHRTVHRPGPGTGGRCKMKRGNHSREQNSAHRSPLGSWSPVHAASCLLRAARVSDSCGTSLPVRTCVPG